MDTNDLQNAIKALQARQRAELVAGVCRIVGIGEGTLQSRARTEDVVRKREVVAWILHARLRWTQREVGMVMGRTERQIRRMLQKA